VLALAALSGCSSSTPAAAPLDAQPAPTATGAVPQPRLEAMLLQPADLPGLTQRRTFATAGLTTQATPQLSLCRAAAPVGPHELANAIAESGRPGTVKVFEIVAAYADAAAAKAAYDHDVASARACQTYSADGVAHRISQLAAVDVGPGAEAVHYALVTSDVISGDVRTYARRGVYTVLVSGFGAPPTRQPLLAYQADLMRKALARLR
jgi:hypothetical protein